MLLNAYGWWKISQIAYIISLTAFGLGAMSVLGAMFGFASFRRDRKLAVATAGPAAATTASAFERISETGHEAGATPEQSGHHARPLGPRRPGGPSRAHGGNIVIYHSSVRRGVLESAYGTVEGAAWT
jgi:hypothetical protein